MYYSSEILTIAAIFNKTGLSDPKEATDKMAQEILIVQSWFNDLILDFRECFFIKYLEDEYVDYNKDKIIVSDMPYTDETEIPFFCLPASTKESR